MHLIHLGNTLEMNSSVQNSSEQVRAILQVTVVMEGSCVL